jgi:hypothetical protein
MKINILWHEKHKLPANTTLDQRVEWHMEHARRCPCPPGDEDIWEELNKRYSGKHQDFWILFNINDHRELGLWAANLADQVLPKFDVKYSRDTRPRTAIETLRTWIKTGEFRMPMIREAALGAHAAAKAVATENQMAEYAAHAAGQAVATAHVPTHAIGTAYYVLKIDKTTKLHPPEKLRQWIQTKLPASTGYHV